MAKSVVRNYLLGILAPHVQSFQLLSASKQVASEVQFSYAPSKSKQRSSLTLNVAGSFGSDFSSDSSP